MDPIEGYSAPTLGGHKETLVATFFAGEIQNLTPSAKRTSASYDQAFRPLASLSSQRAYVRPANLSVKAEFCFSPNFIDQSTQLQTMGYFMQSGEK